MRQYGAYATVQFDDPTIPATIRSICGGWEALCEVPSEQLHNWTRKAFLETYRAISASGKVSAIACAPLSGILAQDAARHGYDIPKPVQIAAMVPSSIKVLPAEEPRRISQAGQGGDPSNEKPNPVERIAAKLASQLSVTAVDEPETGPMPGSISREETERRKAEQCRRLTERQPLHQPGKQPT